MSISYYPIHPRFTIALMAMVLLWPLTTMAITYGVISDNIDIFQVTGSGMGGYGAANPGLASFTSQFTSFTIAQVPTYPLDKDTGTNPNQATSGIPPSPPPSFTPFGPTGIYARADILPLTAQRTTSVDMEEVSGAGLAWSAGYYAFGLNQNAGGSIAFSFTADPYIYSTGGTASLNFEIEIIDPVTGETLLWEPGRSDSQGSLAQIGPDPWDVTDVIPFSLTYTVNAGVYNPGVGDFSLTIETQNTDPLYVVTSVDDSVNVAGTITEPSALLLIVSSLAWMGAFLYRRRVPPRASSPPYVRQPQYYYAENISSAR